MDAPIRVLMPLKLNWDMLRDIREDERTKMPDRAEMDERIVWLLSAWDVLVQHSIHQQEPK